MMHVDKHQVKFFCKVEVFLRQILFPHARSKKHYITKWLSDI